MIKHIDEASFPCRFGKFRIHAFVDNNGREHAVLVRNGYEKCNKEVIVRIHSKCLTGDTFASLRCDCRNQLEAALDYIAKKGSGILIYLDQEGRGIGFTNKIKAYALQDNGADTVEANVALGFDKDLRDYSIAADILKYFGVKSVLLLTNNPEKIKGLEKHGIRVVKRLPLLTRANRYNGKYLKTKKEKLNHMI